MPACTTTAASSASNEEAPTLSRDHDLQLPLKRADVEALRVGDMVRLHGQVTMTIGLRTHQRMVRMLDAGEALPVDLRGGAFMHLSCFNRENADGSHEALYLNPPPARATAATCPR